MNVPIKSYPEFEPLAREHKEVFDRNLRQYPPEISDLTFTNLYSWRRAFRFAVATFADFLIIRAESEEGTAFLDPVGGGDKKETIKRILKDSSAMFARVPGTTSALFERDETVALEPDRDGSDYLYRLSDLVSLAGRKYDGKRNLIRKFRSEYSYQYEPLAGENVTESLKFEERWCTIKDCDGEEGLRNEREAVREMLANYSGFGLTGCLLRIAGAIAGIAFGERLNPDTFVVHVLKADPEIPGLYQTLMNEFLSRLGDAYEYVNLEEDLGIEGLRKAKLSYHPTRMIEKYTLKTAENASRSPKS